MPTFLEKCADYFDSKNFYEILKIEKDATEKEIKKAYHKLSLLVHPDRVEEARKLEATEKFKVLGKVHSILQNPEKRELYDESGEFADDDESDEDRSWMEYWKQLFKPITTKDIDNYKSDYIGSVTELRDIKKAYEGHKGDWDMMFEMVPFLSCDNEPRILEIVRKMVDDGEVEEYERFFNEPAEIKEKRLLKEKADALEVENNHISDDELEKQIQANRKKRGSNFLDMIANFEDKYGGKKSTSKRKSIKNDSEKPQATKRVTRSRK